MQAPSFFLTAEWRYLVMLNYAIDPSILRPLVPAGTELDQWQGATFVSVVGFLFRDTRLFGLPIPFHRHFEEVNLRFYVRRKTADGWRRGVVFIKELVPRAAIAWMARWLYNENYAVAPLRHRLERRDDPTQSVAAASYEWKFRGQPQQVAVQVKGDCAPVSANTEQEFITEHYWGYCRQRDGGTLEYQVDHPRWSAWQAQSSTLQCNVIDVYGAEFAAFLSAPPSSAFLADGSPVTVSRGRRIC